MISTHELYPPVIIQGDPRHLSQVGMLKSLSRHVAVIQLYAAPAPHIPEPPFDPTGTAMLISTCMYVRVLAVQDQHSAFVVALGEHALSATLWTHMRKCSLRGRYMLDLDKLRPTRSISALVLAIPNVAQLQMSASDLAPIIPQHLRRLDVHQRDAFTTAVLEDDQRVQYLRHVTLDARGQAITAEAALPIEALATSLARATPALSSLQYFHIVDSALLWDFRILRAAIGIAQIPSLRVLGFTINRRVDERSLFKCIIAAATPHLHTVGIHTTLPWLPPGGPLPFFISAAVGQCLAAGQLRGLRVVSIVPQYSPVSAHSLRLLKEVTSSPIFSLAHICSHRRIALTLVSGHMGIELHDFA